MRQKRKSSEYVQGSGLAGNAMIPKRISQGGYDDGAELDRRLYYRVSTAFHLITVRPYEKNHRKPHNIFYIQ